MDWDVSRIIETYYKENGLDNKEDGTKVSVDLYASHYISNISLVAKTAYMITEIGNLDRFNDKLDNEIISFIEKYQKMLLPKTKNK